MNKSKIRNLKSAIPFERGTNHHISTIKNTINGKNIRTFVYQLNANIRVAYYIKYRNGTYL